MSMTELATQPPSAPARPLVLVIEDEYSLRKLLALCLKRCGYDVVELNCGDEVLVTPRATLLAAGYALVDDAFPGRLTGPQTVVLLHYLNPRLNLFPISGRPFHDWELELMENHYCQLLPKPFDLKTLLATLHAASVPSLP